MNYKVLKRSMVAAGIGTALWYGVGLSGNDTTPDRMIVDSTRIGCLESIAQDSGDTKTILGFAGKMLFYGGLAGMAIAAFSKKKKK